jgi:DNA-binding transcriptional ArsR family regulator
MNIFSYFKLALRQPENFVFYPSQKMPAKKPYKLSAAQLSAVCRLFSVLSESSRLSLLQALHDGPLTVNELVEAAGMKQANVSKQLAILHDHRLVKRERDGTSIRYEIADPMVFSLCELVCGKMKKDALHAAAVFHPEI